MASNILVTSILEAILRLINTALPALLALSLLLPQVQPGLIAGKNSPVKVAEQIGKNPGQLCAKTLIPAPRRVIGKGAMPLLERAIKIYPGDSFYHFLLAMALSNTGNKQAAIPEFERSYGA